MEVAGKQKRKNSLSAVPPELHLKFQNSEVTVTNWDRVRWFEGPTINLNRGIPLRQMANNAFSHQPSAFEATHSPPQIASG